jgi:septum formation topological specificity factor MinE
MFGSSPTVFLDDYSRRRKRRHLPRWLVLLSLGTALGAGAVITAQQRYLPPRLSAEASADLQQAFQSADQQRRLLAAELSDTRTRLQAAQATQRSLTGQLDSARSEVLRLRDDLAAVVTSLPPDPRNGTVAVRAGRITAQGNRLSYDLVLTRQTASARPLTGRLQLVVAGDNGRGTPATVASKPVPLSMGSQEVVRGSLTLPDGFRPRQTTVQVLDADEGKALGMRVLLIN